MAAEKRWWDKSMKQPGHEKSQQQIRSHLEKQADEWNYIFLHDDIVLFGAKVAKKQCNTIANSSTCEAIRRQSGG